MKFTLLSPLLLFLLSCTSFPKDQAVEKLTVKRLALVDDNGIERVVMTTNSVDVPVLGKTYKRKSPATGIILYNHKGDETGGLAMLDDGTISLTLDGYQGENFSERVSIYVLPDGSSGLLIKDLKNNVRARISVDKLMTSSYEILDKNEKTKIKGAVSAEGRASIEP